MWILAIDPGTTESAYVLYDGLPREYGKVKNEVLNEMIAGFDVEEMAIEHVRGYGKRVGNELFDTCEWTGRFIETFIRDNGGPVHRLARKRVAGACASALDGTPEGYGVSATIVNDSIVRTWMVQQFGEPDGLTKDMWQALALAVTFAEGQRP